MVTIRFVTQRRCLELTLVLAGSSSSHLQFLPTCLLVPLWPLDRLQKQPTVGLYRYADNDPICRTLVNAVQSAHEPANLA